MSTETLRTCKLCDVGHLMCLQEVGGRPILLAENIWEAASKRLILVIQDAGACQASPLIAMDWETPRTGLAIEATVAQDISTDLDAIFPDNSMSKKEAGQPSVLCRSQEGAEDKKEKTEKGGGQG